MLFDNHGRQINYVRLGVTDRCNLRCYYCMPEEGIRYVNRKDLLSYEEMERLLTILGTLGINKLRITGGEPFVRKGMMDFIGRIACKPDAQEIHITTNGTFTEENIPLLEEMGIKSINLSLDSLDRNRFFEITRRDMFDQVMRTLRALLESGLTVKINMVVMHEKNIEDIYPMLDLARDHNLSVRFIEEMPFNGTGGNQDFWPAGKILSHIGRKFKNVIKLEDPAGSTSANYTIPGFNGDFGIIAAYTRSFCGSCNRIRITPQGILKTCLYANGGLNLRDLMRQEKEDQKIRNELINALQNRYKDGFEAEKNRPSVVTESMATIGG